MSKEDAEKYILETVNRIVDEFDPEKVWLFGSRAHGNNLNESSDIDLMVVKDVDDTRALAREIDKEIFPRRMAIDILVSNPGRLEEKARAGDFFAREIIDNGRVMYERGR